MKIIYKLLILSSIGFIQCSEKLELAKLNLTDKEKEYIGPTVQALWQELEEYKNEFLEKIEALPYCLCSNDFANVAQLAHTIQSAAQDLTRRSSELTFKFEAVQEILQKKHKDCTTLLDAKLNEKFPFTKIWDQLCK